VQIKSVKKKSKLYLSPQVEESTNPEWNNAEFEMYNICFTVFLCHNDPLSQTNKRFWFAKFKSELGNNLWRCCSRFSLGHIKRYLFKCESLWIQKVLSNIFIVSQLLIGYK